MPKVNQTMLDKLVDAFKGGSQRKPEIIQATTIRDPLGYSMVQRRFGTAAGKMPSMKSERQSYQEGIKDIQDRKYDSKLDELEVMQNEYEDAFDEAKDMMIDDISSRLEERFAPGEIRGGIGSSLAAFKPRGYFSIGDELADESLADYWPYGAYDSPEYYDRRGREIDEQLEYIDSPEYRMELQRQSPRYRRYQEAMQRRDINRRAGRVNAAIMNLARQGYSLPEIREILRRQGR